MSFSAFTNHMRNPALPHPRRVSALRSCVQLYRPIGFHASLSFLEERAGPFQRDEQALLRAHGHLAASRALWHEHVRRYADQRRAAKLLGHRVPRKTEPSPSPGPTIWYGAAPQAARHGLHYWRRSRLPALLAWDDPGALEISAAVSACLDSSGPFSADQRRKLDTVTQQVRSRINGKLYNDDARAYYRSRDLLQVATLVVHATERPASVNLPTGGRSAA